MRPRRRAANILRIAHPWTSRSARLLLATIGAAPLACHAPATANRLSVVSDVSPRTVAHPPASVTAGEESEVAPESRATDPAPATSGAVPDSELDIDPESYERILERLDARSGYEPDPIERPFTGPWMPLNGSTLSPFLQQQGQPQGDADGEGSGHWSGLPLMSEFARENGIKLPEPFGLSVTYFMINRPSRVTKVRAGVDNGGLHELPSLAFDAMAKVQTVVGRLDAWILPMLNVYLLGGYVWNDSSVDMILDLPGAPGTAFKADGHLEGPVYGAGTTLVGGYANYFLAVDFNYNKVALGGLDEMDAKLLTARVGYRVQNPSWCEEIRYYLATTYWDTARTISGSLPVSGGPISSIQYAVDQEPVDALTVGGGANITFTKNWGLVCEVQGYRDTIYVVGSLAFRF